MTEQKKLFCFGYGYTARALVKRLAAEGGWRFAGTTRDENKADAMRAEGVQPVIWRGGALPDGALDGARVVLVSTPPGAGGCPALAAGEQALEEAAGDIDRIFYLSTNGVYGDHAGAWVDEHSELLATSERAQRRIAAENQWRAFCAARSLRLVIFRLPGIYGPGRSAIESVRNGTARRIVKEGQVFSRMHVADIAAALAAAAERSFGDDVLNLADDEPAPPQDVVEYACGLLDAAPPPLEPIADADMSEMARSFYADNKRVANDRMKEALQMKLQYPTYREGLRAILAETDEAGDGAGAET